MHNVVDPGLEGSQDTCFQVAVASSQHSQLTSRVLRLLTRPAAQCTHICIRFVTRARRAHTHTHLCPVVIVSMHTVLLLWARDASDARSFLLYEPPELCTVVAVTHLFGPLQRTRALRAAGTSRSFALHQPTPPGLP